MQKLIYVFNPEHDMALASYSAYYMTPAHIMKMKSDLSILPIWYAENGLNDTFVLTKEDESHFLKEKQILFPKLSSLSVCSNMKGEYYALLPWGWNPALLHEIEMSDLSLLSLPDFNNLNIVRELSGRQYGLKLLSSFNELEDITTIIGENIDKPVAVSLYSVKEVHDFIHRYNDVMLKAPWSGSGRGVRRVVSELSDSDSGWIQRIIRTQGAVIGEPYYSKVLDFAMEFVCRDSQAFFTGYSIFDTDSQGAYKCNILDSDAALENKISAYVSLSVLNEIKQRLMTLISHQYASRYEGVLGVDMMICNRSDGYWVHPCVEVNLRMNMGIVANRFYNQFVSPYSKGEYHIEHFFKKGNAVENDNMMKEKYPLAINDNMIESGYMSLTRVEEYTLYQIYVIISKK